MDLECSVPLDGGVSFAPTPSPTQPPPRLGAAMNPWVTQPCPACRQQHHPKFVEDVSRGCAALWKDRKPDSMGWLTQSLPKARWTLPGKLITWEGNSQDFFLGRGKGDLHCPQSTFRSSQICSLHSLGGYSLEAGLEPRFSFCVARWGLLHPPLLLRLLQ